MPLPKTQTTPSTTHGFAPVSTGLIDRLARQAASISDVAPKQMPQTTRDAA